jgi:hypothetical protein
MEHDEFVERARSNEIFWGVNGFFRPVFLAWGIGVLLAVVAASLLALAPALVFGVYCVLHQEYAALAWALPTVLAFLAGKPNLNCISGFPWVICAVIGLALTIFFGPLHLVGGLLPGLTWFLSGAVKGVTMVSMESRLSESAEAYKKLKESGALFFRGT